MSLSLKELWLEQPCKHGEVGPHGVGINARLAGQIDCTEGTRHQVTIETSHGFGWGSTWVRLITEDGSEVLDITSEGCSLYIESVLNQDG